MKNVCCIIFCLCAVSVYAQKLPTIQETGLKAPAKIKIDGKIDEWDNQFMAYNRATDVYYSIANDGSNLYVLIQARYSEAIKKIIGGGITFSVIPGGKQTNALVSSATFPLLKAGAKGAIGIKYRNRIEAMGKDAVVNARKTDSMLIGLNSELNINSKEIKLAGMKGQTDSLISVYNEDGYKAAMGFDKQFALNYELAIPLSVLGLSDGATFNYKIAINRINFDDTAVHRVLPDGREVTIVNMPMSIYKGNADFKPIAATDAMFNTTDCKGTYTLVK
jgi:hypothetical protein